MILDQHGRPARRPRSRSNFRGAGIGSSSFEAAKRSRYKTWLYFPSLEPTDQLTELTWTEIAKNINWMWNNVPVARLLIERLSREEVDTGIWPRATSSNPAFNRRATDLWDEEAGDPRFFDESGIESYYTQQLAIRRNIYGPSGEFFSQLLRPGDGTEQATINNIAPWQIRNANKSNARGFDQSQWLNGTRANDFGRVIQYRVITDKAGKTFRDIDAQDLLHFHDPFWKGQRRGLSCLATAARKLFSLDDYDRAAASGELSRQRLAYQITRMSNDDDTEPSIVPGATAVEVMEIENPDGTKSRLHVQRITASDGTDIDIADLPPGRKIETVESEKGAAAKEWMNHMIEDIARCTPYPPEYTFFLAGFNQGTAVRFVQKTVQRIKNIVRQFQIIPQYCKRVYDFKTWQWILAGRFDDVEGGVPKDWYRVRHICPPDDSVDVVRELGIYRDMVNEGNIPPDALQEILGRYIDDNDDNIIVTRIRREKMLEDQRAILEAREPEYSQIAKRLSYDTIFRQPARVTETKTIREQTDDADDPDGTEDDPNKPNDPKKKNRLSRPLLNGHRL